MPKWIRQRWSNRGTVRDMCTTYQPEIMKREQGIPGWHRPESRQAQRSIGFHPLSVAVSLHYFGWIRCKEMGRKPDSFSLHTSSTIQ